MKKSSVLTMIAVSGIALVAGFGGGIMYSRQKFEKPVGSMFQTKMGNGNRMMIQGGRTGNRAAFRPVSGEVISADESSMTVKLEDGSSKIVLIGGSVEVNKSEKATKSDLKNGSKVMVSGTENADGSVTAAMVQITE